MFANHSPENSPPRPPRGKKTIRRSSRYAGGGGAAIMPPQEDSSIKTLTNNTLFLMAAEPPQEKTPEQIEAIKADSYIMRVILHDASRPAARTRPLKANVYCKDTKVAWAEKKLAMLGKQADSFFEIWRDVNKSAPGALSPDVLSNEELYLHSDVPLLPADACKVGATNILAARPEIKTWMEEFAASNHAEIEGAPTPNSPLMW